MSAQRKTAPSRKPAGKRKRPAWRELTGKERVRRVASWAVVAGVVGAVLGLAGFVYVYKTTPIPDPNDEFQTENTYIYYSDGKTELGRLAEQNRDSIRLDQMPACIKDAVVAAENRSFWTDGGIDYKGILRAAFNNARGGQLQGASTITQQYVKILYLSQERTIKRKIKEAILTLKIQKELSKEQILEGYLNTIYFGRGAYGVQAAAQAFFDVNAKNLNLRQCAVLASVINNPTKFDPANGAENRDSLTYRYDYVLDGMAEAGTITAEAADKAKKKLPPFPRQRIQDTYAGQRGHVLTLVKKQLVELGFTDDQIQGGGLRVTTTLTKKAMDAARDGVLAQRPEGFGDKNLHVAVASVEPGTGALRGFYAGQDYLKSQINWAVAGGAPGSTFKAFALAAAITEGYSLKDTFDGNSPYDLPNGDDFVNEGPNGGNDYGSAISMLKAAEESVNTAFIDMTLGMDDGPEKILAMARAMGVPPEKTPKKDPFGIPTSSPGLRAETGISLGSSTQSPINMANAYATIANGGEAADVYLVERVVDKSGEELYHHEVTTHRAVEEDINSDVSYALQQVVKSGTGQNALALGRPAAGKTGTATNGNNDVSSSWFVGFTPQLSTAVMYVRGDGNDQIDGWLPSYFGAVYPTYTWTDVMGKALEGEPVEDFPPPANVDGDAPQDGHAPYVPPPSKTKKPKPSQTPTTTSPSPSPSHTPPGQTKTPDPPPSEPTTTCSLNPLPDCSSPSDSPSPTQPTDTSSPANNGNGGGGNGRRRTGRRRPPAAA